MSSSPPSRQSHHEELEEDSHHSEHGDWGDDEEDEEDDGAGWGDMEEADDDDPFLSDSVVNPNESMTSASRRRSLSTPDHLADDSIPRELQRRIERDLAEVRLLPPYCASDVNLGGGTRVGLRVGFPISSLGMNEEQVRAWGLSNDQLLMVELHFPPHYFNVNYSQIKVTVGMTASTAAPTDQTPLTRCKLSWPMENRIRKHFLPSANPTRCLPEASFSLATASDVAMTCDCDLLTAIRALLDCKNDENAAMLHIADNQPQSAAAASTATQGKRKKSSSGANKRKSAKKNNSRTDTATESAPPVSPLTTVSTSVMSAAQKTMALAQSAFSTLSFGSDPSPPTEEPLPLLALLTPHNLLIQLLTFVRLKIRTLSSTCLLCETPLPFPGLNLSVCSSDLCKLSFEDMGVGFDLASSIVASPLLTDLYISMLSSACTAQHLHFAQPPTVSATVKGSGEVKDFLKDKVIDFTKLSATLRLIPSVKDMVALIQKGVEQFVEAMNALDVLIIPLLRWLFVSCPTYVRPLSEDEKFASVPTCFQFSLLMSSPDKEHWFQELKARAGVPSVYGFHGAPCARWHSILRTGLKNLSNTKDMARQLHIAHTRHDYTYTAARPFCPSHPLWLVVCYVDGAAYGSGIYLASDSATSMSYSSYNHYHQATSGWSHSSMSNNPRYLALVEVVGGSGRFNPYLVIPNDELVSTRFLFVFTEQNTASVAATTLVNEMKLAPFDVQTLHNDAIAPSINTHTVTPKATAKPLKKRSLRGG